MRFLVAIATLSCSWFSQAFAATDTYKWIDEAHATHYADMPPPAQKADKVKLGHNVIETTVEPYEVTQAAKKNPISLFTFAQCGNPCDQTKALLDKRGLPYALRNTDADRAVSQKLTGSREFPVIVIGNRTPIIGFEENRLNAALDEAGYPKSNPLAGLRKALKTTIAAADKIPPAAIPVAGVKPDLYKPGSK